jgi:hypothetical protein
MWKVSTCLRQPLDSPLSPAPLTPDNAPPTHMGAPLETTDAGINMDGASHPPIDPASPGSTPRSPAHATPTTRSNVYADHSYSSQLGPRWFGSLQPPSQMDEVQHVLLEERDRLLDMLWTAALKPSGTPLKSWILRQVRRARHLRCRPLPTCPTPVHLRSKKPVTANWCDNKKETDHVLGHNATVQKETIPPTHSQTPSTRTPQPWTHHPDKEA